MRIARMELAALFVVCVLAAPIVCDAQQAAKIYRIGMLTSGSGFGDSLIGFRDAFRQLGYVEHRNFIVEEQLARGDAERLRSQARDLVRLHVDVIIAYGTPASLALKEATPSIPIVLLSVADPIGAGLITSLSRPGGNITGVSASFGELAPKYVQLIRELAPGISRIAFFGNTENPTNRKIVFPQLAAAAHSVGAVVEFLPATGADDFSRVLAAVSKLRIQGLVVPEDAAIRIRMHEIVQFAAKTRLPAVYFGDDYARAGGLLSYGAARRGLGRQAAVYVDKILKGAKPADLPVEQPTKFDLIINMKTAKAIGLTIPPSLLLRADEVIE
jgi:ABC-type uncharacterized transport system substrate-binding protein